MKKFGFLLLAVAALLVGCTEPNTEVVVNGINLNVKTLNLSIGASEFLKATTDPAGVKVEWISSDPTIAKVNGAGNVQGIGEGECTITAKAGDKTASCKVTVSADALYDEFAISDWGLFGDFENIAGTDTVIELSDGMYDVCLAKISLYIWGDGITLASNHLTGAGLFAAEDVYVYRITSGQYKDYYVGNGGWFVENLGDQIIPYSIQSGVYDIPSYGKIIMASYNEEAYNAWTDDDMDDYKAKNYGLNFSYVDIENSDESADWPYGWINKAILIDASEKKGTSSQWAADITWANLTAEDRQYGFLFDLDLLKSDKIFNLVTDEQGNYDFSTIHRVFDEDDLFSQYDLNEAPKYTLGDMSRYHKELPMINGRVLDTKTLHQIRK